MPNTTQTAERDMTDEEIEDVFETLNLPTAPKPVPIAVEPVSAPLIFFTISGSSPPLNAR